MAISFIGKYFVFCYSLYFYELSDIYLSVKENISIGVKDSSTSFAIIIRVLRNFALSFIVLHSLINHLFEDSNKPLSLAIMILRYFLPLVSIIGLLNIFKGFNTQ